jgi:pimeloyl-ACP methyl ester carboxylesterase
MTVAWHRLSTGGPAVILVHGLEDSWQSWTPVAQLLAPHYELIALELPWCAGNDYTWRADGTPGHWLDRALSLVPQPIHGLVAHSFGANAAMEVLSAGRAVDRVALLAPLYHPHISEEGPPVAHRALESTVRRGLQLKVGTRTVAPTTMAAMERKLLEHVMSRALPVLFDCLVATNDLDLSAVNGQTLVLSGTTDICLPPSGTRALAEAIPTARVRQHAHYTHFCHLEQTTEVTAELNAFLCPTR